MGINLNQQISNKDIFTGTFFGMAGVMVSRMLFRFISCLFIAIMLPVLCLACTYLTLSLVLTIK